MQTPTFRLRFKSAPLTFVTIVTDFQVIVTWVTQLCLRLILCTDFEVRELVICEHASHGTRTHSQHCVS